MHANEQTLIRRIHDYQRISGFLWIAFGVLQVLAACPLALMLVGIPIALMGAWNIYAGMTHLKIAPAILMRDETIPARFESMTSLIVVTILNLVLGAIIGALFCIIDFYVRDQILANRHLFTQPTILATTSATTKL